MPTVSQPTTNYDLLLDLVTIRASIRKLKPDPIPDDYVTKILEVGRWAMSGANSQPWEFIVVRDPKTKEDLFRAYNDINQDFVYWMEQQRVFELRHPSYQLLHDEAVKKQYLSKGFSEAPVLIVLLGDGRLQWGTVMGAMTFGRNQTHLTDGLSIVSVLMHLAAAALGLGSQHVTIHIQEPFKRILGVPDLLMLPLIIPVGYPAVEPKRGVRRALAELVHQERYDMSRYITNEQALKYLYDLRKKTMGLYRQSFTGDTVGGDQDKKDLR